MFLISEKNYKSLLCRGEDEAELKTVTLASDPSRAIVKMISAIIQTGMGKFSRFTWSLQALHPSWRVRVKDNELRKQRSVLQSHTLHMLSASGWAHRANMTAAGPTSGLAQRDICFKSNPPPQIIDTVACIYLILSFLSIFMLYPLTELL